MSEPGTPDVDDPADESPDATADGDAGESDADGSAPEPSWWHRSHPTFAGLVGFFSGVAFVIVVPGLYAALLGLLLSDDEVKRLFPLVVLILIVPLALLLPRKTRRFAQFMLLGAVATAVVIVATAALVIWVMVQIDG
ncbi:MAG: hypothetical protein QM747_01380 [Nocardioides sp.]